jgi:hypothetical protein
LGKASLELQIPVRFEPTSEKYSLKFFQETIQLLGKTKSKKKKSNSKINFSKSIFKIYYNSNQKIMKIAKIYEAFLILLYRK